MPFMKSNLERGFWRLAIAISCVWWFIWLSLSFASMVFGENDQFVYFFLLMAAGGVVPIVVFYLVRWIVQGFRGE